MHPYGRLSDRLAKVERELWEIDNNGSPEGLIIGDERFNHAAWLEAESEELDRQREALSDTVTLDDQFVGAES